MASVVRGTEAINPLLAPGLLRPRPNNHFLASGLTRPRPIPLFGFGYLENRGLKLGSNCKNATASLYASVPDQPRHIRRGKMGILH